MGAAVDGSVGVRVAILARCCFGGLSRRARGRRRRRRASTSATVTVSVILLLLHLADTTPLGHLPAVHVERKVLQAVLVLHCCCAVLLCQLQTVFVRIGVVVDLFVDEFGYVECSMHQVCAKVGRRVVVGQLEPVRTQLGQRLTRGVRELADDGFGGRVVAAPVPVPFGQSAVVVWVIAAEKGAAFVALRKANPVKNVEEKGGKVLAKAPVEAWKKS